MHTHAPHHFSRHPAVRRIALVVLLAAFLGMGYVAGRRVRPGRARPAGPATSPATGAQAHRSGPGQEERAMAQARELTLTERIDAQPVGPGCETCYLCQVAHGMALGELYHTRPAIAVDLWHQQQYNDCMKYIHRQREAGDPIFQEP